MTLQSSDKKSREEWESHLCNSIKKGIAVKKSPWKSTTILQIGKVGVVKLESKEILNVSS